MARHEGKEGKVALAKSLGATAALGGVTALPMYATAMAVVQLIIGSDDDWTEKIRRALPKSDMLRDMAIYGLPAGFGVTLGGSLGVEAPIVSRLSAADTPQTALADNLGDILGIPWDLFVKKPTRIMTALENENDMRALEEAMPTVIKNIMQAYRLWNEGHTSLRGAPIEGEKLSTSEMVARAIGFQPVSAVRQWDSHAATKRSMAIRSETANKIAAKIMAAIKDKDYAAQKKAQSEWMAWNEQAQKDKKPWLIVTGADIRRRLKGRMKGKRPNRREMLRKKAMGDVW
ncbi:PLxRFG domain-containing protein [Halodesulfovibrio sp.]|uniref:PLxRFG domain-containing protein n=1 Tax=Halodesulfovibrio sp. TaxID=1912772 RepID=UPI0025ED96B1|nr:PLxRFG domain-containing protein [Halodesulfovibrio sp.]MCT4626451.1 PLxRFG domain-containing protein [Halodesulfovibrio sp.]